MTKIKGYCGLLVWERVKGFQFIVEFTVSAKHIDNVKSNDVTY